MDSAYLAEYEAKEIEEQGKFDKRYLRDGHAAFPLHRFKNLKRPVAHRAVDSVLWPQIPLFGSLIIPIFPAAKEKFSENHKFEIGDLDRLIDIWRDTGRVQFALGAGPTRFADLDYLDRLLTEVRPIIGFGVPSEALGTAKVRQTFSAEFDTAASVSFWPYVKDQMEYQGFGETYAGDRYGQLREAFVRLRLLGYRKLTNNIMDYIGVDPDRAYLTLLFNKRFVLGGVTDPVRGIQCYSLDELNTMKSVDVEGLVHIQAKQLPNEIGSFLLKELTPVAESLRASEQLIELYEQEDLQKTVDALYDAVCSSNVSLMEATSADLSAVLRNVWSDSERLRRRVKGVSHVMALTFGAAGYAASQLLGEPNASSIGLLAGLGFKLFDQSLTTTASNISERLAKFASKSYVSTIFDFRRKYRIR